MTLIYLEWPVGRAAGEADGSLRGIAPFTFNIQLPVPGQGTGFCLCVTYSMWKETAFSREWCEVGAELLPCSVLYLQQRECQRKMHWPYSYPTDTSAVFYPLVLSFFLRNAALFRLCRWKGLCMFRLMLIYFISVSFLSTLWSCSHYFHSEPKWDLCFSKTHHFRWDITKGEFTVICSHVSLLSVKFMYLVSLF